MARRAGGSRSRGEVAEVTHSLEQLCTMNGSKSEVVQLKRDCFQKLIRYMTAGINMSAALVPATKCVALSKTDLPLKKMLYLYLRTAARQNGDVALLVVQAMLNDAVDADPAVRGLAVRSMCSLRVPDLMDSVVSTTARQPATPPPPLGSAARRRTADRAPASRQPNAPLPTVPRRITVTASPLTARS
jgi:hypothetical protein